MPRGLAGGQEEFQQLISPFVGKAPLNEQVNKYRPKFILFWSIHMPLLTIADFSSCMSGINTVAFIRLYYVAA